MTASRSLIVHVEGGLNATAHEGLTAIQSAGLGWRGWYQDCFISAVVPGIRQSQSLGHWRHAAFSYWWGRGGGQNDVGGRPWPHGLRPLAEGNDDASRLRDEDRR